ncbi:MAG: LacI family DNA-binding transcriptional regulator [Lentisphaeria bacterium]|nr:LacI family DNA-binding transcriptional regulator [Lentisphaeria bacterium]
MPVTIHDLARLSGLNASTISRALRNDPRVRKTTRELVRKLARKHGYTPNLPARQLAAGKTGNIWFCFGSPQAAIELETAIALDTLVTREHHDLQLVLHGNSAERLEHLLGKLCQQVADGALIIPPGDTGACLELSGLLNNLPIPHVLIDRYWEGVGCPVVTTDNRAGVRRLIDRCVEWGAREFYLEYAGGNPVSRIREEAAKQELAERELPFHPYPASNRIESRVPAAVVGNSSRVVPECETELYGGFFDACEGAALRVYRHVIVCRQDFPAIADRAASILFDLLRDPAAPVPPFTEIPPLEYPEY